MKTISKIMLATVALAAMSACSSEMSEEEQAIYDARKADEAKPTNMLAMIQSKPELSTANTAIGLSGITADLGTEGPFTAFVATNDAFNKMDGKKLDAMMEPEGKQDLADLLEYSVMIANLTSADIAKAIAEGGGSTELKMVKGGSVKAMMEGDKIVLEDAKGNKSTIIEADVKAKNGIIHVIDTVLIH